MDLNLQARGCRSAAHKLILVHRYIFFGGEGLLKRIGLHDVFKLIELVANFLKNSGFTLESRIPSLKITEHLKY